MISLTALKTCLTFVLVSLASACAPSVRGAPSSTDPSGDDTVDQSPPVATDPDPASDFPGDFDDAASPTPDPDEAQDALDQADAMGDDAGEADIPADGLEAAVADAVQGPPFDVGEGGICPGGVGPGDLMVTELMIASMAGTGDHGEWLEVTSTRECALDLLGLHGEVPSGSKVRVVDIDDDLWLPAFGTFVIADSIDPALTHYLPGTVIAWAGQPGDVLRNEGATITFLVGGQVVASTTYPSLKLTDGSSLAFPADCPPTSVTDWTAWQFSTASWFPGFYGTPNAPNTDVHCTQ
jgi:hypothetical protein